MAVLLTDRDTRLLYDCYHNAVLSISQIRTRHFPAAAKATAFNRLSKLQRAGYIKSQRVGIVIYQGIPRKIGAVYQITNAALQYLKSRYPDGQFRSEPIRLNSQALQHDLILTDVITALKEASGREIVRGELRPIEGARIPDAVVLDTSGRPTGAVELELTAKSHDKYRDIVLKYMLASEYRKVLYVTADREIADKIKHQIHQGKPNPLLPPPPTGKFYFAALQELLSSPKTALISNGQVDFEKPLTNQKRGDNE